MSKARSVVCWLSLLLAAAGCASDPTAESLDAGAPVEATSARGLASGTLRVVGDLTTGSNDFELTLAPEGKTAVAELEGFTASMPAHGHVALPHAIDDTAAAYRIVALPLSMPGVWRLTGSLAVDGTDDSISFDVDVP